MVHQRSNFRMVLTQRGAIVTEAMIDNAEVLIGDRKAQNKLWDKSVIIRLGLGRKLFVIDRD